MIVKALILICSTSVSATDCQPNTAIDVIRPSATVSMQECLMAGMTIPADNHLTDGKTWAKIVCRPDNAPQVAGAGQ